MFYMLISAIGEIVSTSISFWIPTYTSEHLGVSPSAASIIYSVISLSSLVTPFITLLIYEKVLHCGIKTALVMYALSALFFIGVHFTKTVLLNIALLLAAKMAASCAASTVWSTYIPSLAKSGIVSSANGIINSAGYTMAAVANVVFSSLVGVIGWSGVTSMWYIIMLFGAVAAVTKLAVKHRKCNRVP